MKKITTIFIFLATTLSGFAETDTNQLNSNILSCVQNGSMLSYCKTPSTPISAGYMHEMEFDLTYSFICFGSPMTLAFSTTPYNASYSAPFTSNSNLVENPKTITAYGRSLSLIDLNPELTYSRTYFAPCIFIVKTLAIDFSPNTKNILELYLKSMQQTNILIPLAKNLVDQVRILQVVFNSIDIPHLQNLLLSLKNTVQQTITALEGNNKAAQALSFIANEIDLEIRISPGLDKSKEQQLRQQISNTFTEINSVSDLILSNISTASADYYQKAQSILASIKDVAYINQDTYKNYQTRFDAEYEKSVRYP